MYKRFLLCALLLWLPATSVADEQLAGECEIRFYGDSTLHQFEGTGACEPFVLTEKISLNNPLQIYVNVAGLDTDNSSRDKKMREMFEAEKFPTIIGEFKGLDASETLASWQNKAAGELEFDLTIRDVSHTVRAGVSGLDISEESIRFMLTFELSLENYGLEAPGVLGIIRVDDEVRVEVEVLISGPIARAFPQTEVQVSQ